MKPSAKSGRDKDVPKRKPSHLEEARRIINEYAEDLREIIKKLRRGLNGNGRSA
jgi:signal recognition particle subunit SEC65